MKLSCQSSLIHYGNFLFKYRNIVFPLVLVVLLFGFRPLPLSDNTSYSLGTSMLGFFISAMGEGIRVAVIGLAYIKRGGLNKRVHADTLVQEGIFAHCRNPLYLGNLLILFGLFLIHNNPWVYFLGLGFFLTAYTAIVMAEEAYLEAKFGADYQSYCRRVNRWLPRLRGLGKTLGSMQFNWRRVIAKDYASAYSWMVLALLIMGYKALLFPLTEQAALWLKELGILFILLTTVFIIARYLKKSGCLAEKKG
ncbi:methyltransferase family protein [Nitrosococcus watsonii]|uniref:S-isoprenylcysteine methyltransferase-like protein n=1 Tax=Nitrosococcus watsoni (strain C-113) TaxID=105559 RepID=D8K9F2_NITWC|nr:methyltransferase [Nitrosococcus watsonii]ADJ27241.1 S-isoprenylcysteine methyltransferase-like protein [Nitrosococcus watsonii C-113]